MKLYFHPLSGHSHRARLFLSLLGVAHELEEINLASAEHKSAGFLKLNRFGQVPVLVDGETVVADSGRPTGTLKHLQKKPQYNGGFRLRPDRLHLDRQLRV
jgi:glutathione S-transferase